MGKFFQEITSAGDSLLHGKIEKVFVKCSSSKETTTYKIFLKIFMLQILSTKRLRNMQSKSARVRVLAMKHEATNILLLYGYIKNIQYTYTYTVLRRVIWWIFIVWKISSV